MAFRMRVSQRPTSVRRIILPPLFMSTGALMFFHPTFQVSFNQVLEAIIIGVICSVFLIRTSHFEFRNDEIYLKPSKVFPFVLLLLLTFRTFLKISLGSKVTFGETSGVFFLLGFGMIFTWRLAMLYKYKMLKEKLHKENRRNA